ncbi:Glycosyltransferase, catalytic subunit of cellulose synthase and poly-beta-1,6-N-acetylglucosamine synthase [Flavobacteriaceae bacterium MAR_2010_188]|nr:Glycosyltransferase, catalytic subunit of cellulose synthase and poly-beta-1,6-N-acetylglucosamine synthase [Flavobacteriaceae bacterium MAR_2010_188]
MKQLLIADLSNVLAIFILITLLYLFLIGSLIIGFDKVETFYIPELKAKTKFSIIVPFRNEAENLHLLLSSFSKLEYPINMFQLIFINDESSDDSENIIANALNKTQINFRILQNEVSSNSPKKDAISLGIDNAENDWIITTDADCKVPKYWLASFDGFIQRQSVDMIIAPVVYFESESFLDRFQMLDNMSLQGASVGGFGINKPFLCNGANLAYRKNKFLKLRGFEGNKSIASGDDIFAMQKFIEDPECRVSYLKSELAIVETLSQPNLKSLIAQRIRWAAKSKNYKPIYAKVVAVSVFLMNAALIAGIIFVVLGLFPLKNLLSIFVIKISLDFLLLFKAARFLNKDTILLSYVWSCFIYPFFTVYIAVRSVFGGYKWKDRGYLR